MQRTETTSSRPGHRRGIVFMLVAVASFSLMDAGLKLLAGHYPPMQVAALRGLVALPLVAAWALATVPLAALYRIRWPLHLARGALSVLMLYAFAAALGTLSLSQAYALFFVAPLLIAALAVPLLGERVAPLQWLAIAAGFVGVLVVLRPTGGGIAGAAGALGMLAALCYALSAITVRVLGRTDSTQAMVFWMAALLSLGAGLLALPDWVPIARAHYGALALMAVTGAFGQYALTEAFRLAPASVVAPFEYTALHWALAIDALFWQLLPQPHTLLGAAIVMLAGVYLLRRERAANPVEPP